jgi:predicted RNase H-like nuclease (RuvC/YqgF family)
MEVLRCCFCGRTKERGHDSECTFSVFQSAGSPWLPNIAEPDDEKIERLEAEVERLARERDEARYLHRSNAERHSEWCGYKLDLDRQTQQLDDLRATCDQLREANERLRDQPKVTGEKR